MNFSDNILQNIEDYLNGSMNAEELKVFENQINENPELAEAIVINKELRLQYGDDNWNFIKEDKEDKDVSELEFLLKSKEFKSKKNAIQSASNLYFKKEQSKNSGNNKSKLYYVLAIAVAMIIFFGIFSIDNSLTNQEIYSNNSNWDLPSLVSRGETNESLLSKGENAFINKNYELASETFIVYLNNEAEIDITALLYLGISQLELEKHNEALNNFQKIIDSKTLDQSKGYWYKMLAYLKMEDRDNAIKELNIIVKDSKSFNFAEAEKLLKKLKN